MSGAIKLERDKLTISLGHLYDEMSEDDRLGFLDLVCGERRLILHVCQAIAGGCEVEPIFFNDLRDDCLKALLPVLDAAVARSLADALAKAEKYELAENQLRDMAQVYSMLSEADGNMKSVWANQWAQCLLNMRAMYPEFQPATV